MAANAASKRLAAAVATQSASSRNAAAAFDHREPNELRCLAAAVTAAAAAATAVCNPRRLRQARARSFRSGTLVIGGGSDNGDGGGGIGDVRARLIIMLTRRLQAASCKRRRGVRARLQVVERAAERVSAFESAARARVDTRRMATLFGRKKRRLRVQTRDH